MLIRFLTLTVLLFSQSVLSAAKIEHWKTHSDTPVFYVETKGLPMLDIRIVFDAGSARDGYQQGIAALTANLLDAGAGHLSADDIARQFESVGAQLSGGISQDNAWLSLRTLTEPKWMDKALQTLHTVLVNPSFREADFQREKNRTLAGLKHREESPGAVARIAFLKSLYQNHPYAHPGSGIIETVSGFTAADLKQFYRQYYVAHNAMLVMVGDIDRQQAETIAENLLKDLPVGTRPAPIPPVPVLTQGFNKHIPFPSTQTHVLSGLIGMSRQDPDYLALYVGNHILGGSGLVSLMSDEIREKRGLAYSAYSYFSPLFRKGPFIMGLQTRNNQASQAVKIMQKTLKKFISQGPSEAQLIAAKKNITGGFALRFDSNRKLINYVSMIGFYQLPLNYLDTFQQRVEKVTTNAIKQAFQRRIKPELLHTITVGR